jgi:hypothetical protein
VLDNSVHRVLATDQRQVFMHDDPLIVPAHDLLALANRSS